MNGQEQLAAAIDEVLAEAEELALEDERELWKSGYVAVLRSGGCRQSACQEADAAVRLYRERFGERALMARQMRCSHRWGEGGLCVLCGIDVAHARAGFTTPAPPPVMERPAVIDITECTCAIPTMPAHEHGESCPVRSPAPGPTAEA